MRQFKKRGYVYILTNKRRGVLYIGVTSHIVRRYDQHTQGVEEKFSKRYRLHRLVYVEVFDRIDEAIVREKQLKNWHRPWKINLIESVNPEWRDLSLEIATDPETSSG